MIVFDLKCSNGHTFEGWFDDTRTYEDQKEKSLIACPVCNNTCVSKIPSVFAIKSSRPVKEHADPPADMAALADKIIDFVDKNFDDVGCDFAREALKIHYGVSEARNIKGTTTSHEEKILKDEGIEFFKIPMPRPSDTDT